MTTGDFALGLGTVVATCALVGATVMLAIVTWQLSKTAEHQTRLLEKQTDIQLENQQMDLDRDRPKLLLRQAGHSVSRNRRDGTFTTKHFDGFSITNAGQVAVTVTAVSAAFATPADSPDRARSIPSVQLAPKEWDGTELKGDSVPIKLMPGDMATMLFDGNDLERENRPFQWICKDSLGTIYRAEGWWRRSEDILTYMGDDLSDEFTVPDSSYQMWTISRPSE